MGKLNCEVTLPDYKFDACIFLQAAGKQAPFINYYKNKI